MACSYAQQQNFQSQHQQHQQPQQQQPQQHRSNLRKLNYSNTINTTMPINNSTSPSPLQHQPIAKQLNSNLSTDQQIKFIQRLESEIDLLWMSVDRYVDFDKNSPPFVALRLISYAMWSRLEMR